jgi:cyanate permease
MLCFLLFAHNLLARIEGEDQRMSVWLGTRQWQLLLLFGILSLLCQLMFWSEVVQVNHGFTRRT